MAEEKADSLLLERYAAILRTVMDAFWVTDGSGRIVEVNDRACAMSGYSRDELLRMSIGDIEAADDAAAIAARIGRLRKEGEDRFESVHRKRDGSLMDVEVSVAFLPLGDSCFVCFIRDITRRKRGEAALRQSEERYRSLIERSWDIIFELSLDGRFTFVSPSWTRMLGHEVQEVVGRHFGDFVHPDDVPACQAWLAEVVKEGRRVKGFRGYRVRRLDGSILWNESDVAPILDQSGKVTGFEGIAKDITERIEMEARVRAADEELERYFDLALDLLCIVDVEGRYLRVNPEWERKLGWTLDRIIGRLFVEFVHPDDVEATRSALRALGSGEEVTGFLNRYRCRDGSYRWFEWHSKAQGEIIYAVARDVTDRVLTERRIQGLLAEKELILREVHHRVKNNLSAVQGLLVMEGESLKDNAEAVGAFSRMVQRVQGMTVLYDRLYRSDNPVAVSVSDYLPALVAQILGSYPGRAHIEVETRADAFVLDSKRAQVVGIIVNELLSNVMKYAFPSGRKGKVLVSLTTGGKRALLVVQDNGTGIPESVHLETTMDFGLMLVRNLSIQLMGELGLEREGDWGRGTRFTLSFTL